MEKMVFTNKLNYACDSLKSHAPFKTEFTNYGNRGNLCQWIFQYELGIIPTTDNLPYTTNSDIELADGRNISVKSSKATLINNVIGYNLQSTLTGYFENTHSNTWAWVELYDNNQVAVYLMNKAEFTEFTKRFGRYDKDGRVRYAVQSSKTTMWLNIHC